MQVEHLWLDHKGRVDIFYTGADYQTDYVPMSCRVSQRYALEVIAKDGTAPRFYVTGINSRTAGEEWPDEMRKAKAFCERHNLPFRDQVWFPTRDTYEEADADRALEPNLDTKVQCFDGWRSDNTRGTTWRAVLVKA